MLSPTQSTQNLSRINNLAWGYGIIGLEAPLADWGGSELIIRLQTGSIPVGRT